jgi:type I restriction enzyme M protein
MGTLAAVVQSELDRVSQALTGRIKQLAGRYAAPMPAIAKRVEESSGKVDAHLKKMGYVWE